MTERLQGIHALLRAGNVPCALGRQAGLGLVLLAGAPDRGDWDVMVRESGNELLVHDHRGVERVPRGSTDAAVSDLVKFHVVRAWADRGDPAARAVLDRLESTPWRQGDGRYRERPAHDPAAINFLSLFDPFHYAERMVHAAFQLGNLVMTPQPKMAAVTFWAPWGVAVRSSYSRR